MSSRRQDTRPSLCFGGIASVKTTADYGSESRGSETPNGRFTMSGQVLSAKATHSFLGTHATVLCTERRPSSKHVMDVSISNLIATIRS